MSLQAATLSGYTIPKQLMIELYRIIVNNKLMKNLILILSLFVASISAFAQNRYISLQECNNDTLEYVKANFTGKNIEKYINQPFGIFADDLI